MSKKSFLIYFDWEETFSCLNNDELGEMFRALFHYAKDGTEPTLNNRALQLTFSILKKTIDRDCSAYESRCIKNAENGKKGGRPKKQTVIKKSEWFFEKPKKADIDKDIDRDKDKDNISMSFSAKKDGENYSADFLNFWDSYPKKVGKGAAYKTWKKIKPTKAEQTAIVNALNWQIQAEQWKRNNGQYIPNPTTYLNQRRWEDEPTMVKIDITDPNSYDINFDDSVFNK